MPIEEMKPKNLVGFLVQYRYAFTMLAMAFFALTLKLYAEDGLKVANLTLAIGIILLTVKARLIIKSGESIFKQVEQWLFEFGIILIITGFSTTNMNTVFSAVSLFVGFVFIIMFILLVMRKILN